MMNPSVFLPNEDATLAWGSAWANILQAPLTIYLLGGLGAGKTTFTRGLLRGLGHNGAVKSPTYSIVESYAPNQMKVHHFDLYRFTYPEEWEDAGLDDLIAEQALCLIEWPQQGGDFVPAADLIFHFQNENDGRLCAVEALSEKGKECFKKWQN